MSSQKALKIKQKSAGKRLNVKNVLQGFCCFLRRIKVKYIGNKRGDKQSEIRSKIDKGSVIFQINDETFAKFKLTFIFLLCTNKFCPVR